MRSPFTPLRDGEILDAGYHEIMCTRSTANRLMSGGMTHVNGEPVRLRVIDEVDLVDAVIVKVEPLNGVREHPPGMYSWQQNERAA